MNLDELVGKLRPELANAIKSKDFTPLFESYLNAIKKIDGKFADKKLAQRLLTVICALDVDCVPTCLVWSTDSNPFKRETAMKVLAEIGDQSSRHILVRLKDPNSYVREAAVRALGSRGDDRVVEQI